MSDFAAMFPPATVLDLVVMCVALFVVVATFRTLIGKLDMGSFGLILVVSATIYWQSIH